MTHYVFPSNCFARIDGQDHDIGDRDGNPYSNGRLLLTHAVTGKPFKVARANGEMERPDDEDWDELIASGRAELVSKLPDDPTRRIAEMTEMSTSMAVEVDPKSLKRLAQVEALDDAGVPNGDKSILQWLAANWTGSDLEKEFGPHDPVGSIRRWRRERGRAGERKAKQMVSMAGRVPRVPYLKMVPNEIMWKHLVRKGVDRLEYGSLRAAMSTELARVNDGVHPNYPQPDRPYELPSETTMRRAMRKLRVRLTDEAERGTKWADAEWGGGGRPLTAERAMQKVIVDHTRLDIHVVDDDRKIVLGRPWITLAIDVHSRAVVGFLITFIDPSSWTVSQILRRIMLPKKPPTEMARRYPILKRLRGKPHTLITDNGREFRAENALAAARGCGFIWCWVPANKPTYRAIGERPMGTIPRMILEGLPGRTETIAEARKSGRDSEEEAFVIMRELEALTNMAVARYNTEPHSGLDGRQPALVFEKSVAVHGIHEMKDMKTFHIEMMPFADPVTMNGAGLRWEGCRFLTGRTSTERSTTSSRSRGAAWNPPGRP